MEGSGDGEAGLFAAFFEGAADAFLVLGPEGEIRAANGAWERRFGWAPGALLGCAYAELLAPRCPARAALAAQGPAALGAEGRHLVRHAAGGARLCDWRGAAGPAGLVFATLREVAAPAGAAAAPRAIEAAGRVGVWELCAQTGALRCSPPARALLGLPEGAASAEALPGPWGARLGAALAGLRETGEGFDLELEAGPRAVRIAGGPPGPGARAVGIVEDLSERRAARTRLERFAAVAEATTNGVILADAEGRIDWVNPAFAALSGYRLAELVGRKPGAVLQCAETCPETVARIRAALRAGQSFQGEILNRAKTGRLYWIWLEIQPLRDAEGRITGHLGVETDITEERATAERLERAEFEARAARTRLVAACEALDDGFALYDKADRLVLCNERYRKLYGASAPAIRPGATFEEILRYGLDRGQYADAVGREEAWLAERLAVHRDCPEAFEQKLGDGRWLRVLERPTPDGGRVGLRTDITELKRQQAALEAANAELSAALQARDAAETRFFDIAAVSSDWFWEQDAEGRFTFLSESFARSTGGDPDAFIGRTREEIRDARAEKCGADWDWLAARIAERESFMDFIYRIDLHIGERWVRISGAPFFDRTGAFAGYRGVGSDVSELFLARRRAEEASRAKSLFLANMSHEIRTPMNGVMGMADLLESSLTDPAHRHMIAAIRDSGEALLTILDDILDFSKIEAGKLTIERVSFLPADIARRVESLHTLKASERGLSFAVTMGAGVDAPRLGDPHRILQVLHNLVSNAIKFTQVGEVTVAFSAPSGGPVAIEVRDTGIGMTEAQVAAVFEDFVQADSSTTRKFGGTGLGMSIVRRLVQAMDGRIELDSAPGRGTRVRVTLPLGPAEAEPPAPRAPEPPPIPKGLRVLAADDNRTNRMVLSALLARLGVAAEVVEGGPEAVAAAEARAFDLYLLDISMPEMDGIEALAEIRRREAAQGRAAAPAVAVTANALTHQVESYLARGFAGHVAKPIRSEVLARAILDCRAARAETA